MLAAVRIIRAIGSPVDANSAEALLHVKDRELTVNLETIPYQGGHNMRAWLSSMPLRYPPTRGTGTRRSRTAPEELSA